MNGLAVQAEQEFLREQRFKEKVADLHNVVIPLITIAKFKTDTPISKANIPWHRAERLCDSINKSIKIAKEGSATATLNLVKIDRHIDGTLSIDQRLFMDIFHDFGFDPYWLHLVQCSVYGIFSLPKKDGALYTFYFHSGLDTLLWSYNVHERCTKVMIILREMDMTGRRPPTFGSFVESMEHHKALIDDWRFCSLLCAIQLVQWIEDTVSENLRDIRSTETETEPGVWRTVGKTKVPPGPDELAGMSKKMGIVLKLLANVARHASIARTILCELSLQRPPLSDQTLSFKTSTTQSSMPQSGHTAGLMGRSFNSGTSGITGKPSLADEIGGVVILLTNRIESGELQARYLQERAQTQRSVIFDLFNLLARYDAGSALKDSYSMKTIAIMTMVFLPPTFFATLFAMPLLKWDSPQVIQPKFGIYWAFSLPCTVMVILIWDFTSSNESIFSKCWGKIRLSRKDEASETRDLEK